MYIKAKKGYISFVYRISFESKNRILSYFTYHYLNPNQVMLKVWKLSHIETTMFK